MIKLFTSHSGYKTLKKFSSSFVTALMLLQMIAPAGIFLASPALAAAPDSVSICHKTGDTWMYMTTPAGAALEGHLGHGDFLFTGTVNADDAVNTQWCIDNAPQVPSLGTLTVTKVVSGGTKVATDFPLFVNGMSITSGVATTTLTAGTYTVTETGSADYTGSFSGDCNVDGEVDVTAGGSASCTLTNTFTGGNSEGDTFKVKILKYVNGVQATASSAASYAFPFASSWSSPSAGSGTYTIDGNGFGGGAAYQAWTADMTGPADYSTHEITSDIDASSNVLPVGAECVAGKFRLDGYRTGDTIAHAEAAALSTSSPVLSGINSEQYIIVYNENCPDVTPLPTATLTATKIVCASESDLPNWSGGADITATTATDYVANHPNCHLEPNWQFQARFWGPSDNPNLDLIPNAPDPGGSFVGATGSPWTTLSGMTNASGTISTTFDPDDVWHIFVREVLKDGYIPFSAPEGGFPGSDVSAEMYCGSDVLNYDNLERIDGPFNNGDHFYCVAFNAPKATTTPDTFKVRIFKYLDGVQATASSSNSYAFPFQASFTSPSVGSGNYTVGPAGWGGSPAYQAWTSDMTGPADYSTHEITSDLDVTSNVLPVGSTCIPGKYELDGYKTGSTLANAEAAALSTTSPVFTGISSDQYVIAYNHTCAEVPGTGHLVVNKVVINDNGGTGTTTDFSFLVNGTSSTHFNVGGHNVLTLDAGTYNITEASATGYTASYDGCSGISLLANGTSTCTITNNDIAPNATGTLIIKKIVINNEGGTGTTTDFSFELDNGSSTAFKADGQNNLVVAAGTHSIVETPASGYVATYDGCTNISVAGGETKTCTITNNDVPPLQCPVTDGFIESDANTTIDGGGNAALLTFIHPGWTADVDGASTSAKWIWSTDPVATTTATTTATFTRTFTVNGSSTSAILNIAADNTYRVWVNGNEVASTTDGDNFTLASQDSYNVSNLLVDGTNTLTIEVTNLPTPDVTDPNGNPAGLLYRLDWSANDCPIIVPEGGDNGGTDTTTTHHHHSSSISDNTGGTTNNPEGQVLGISTSNPNTPLGQVLGISSTLPGFPNTGGGPITDSNTSARSGLAVIVIGLLAVSGLYVLQFRLLRKR